MNRRIVLLITIVFVMLAMVVGFIVEVRFQNRLDETLSESFKRRLQVELGVVAQSVRNDLIAGNVRSVRAQLTELAKNGVFSGFQLYQNEIMVGEGGNIVSSKGIIKNTIPIYFGLTAESAHWGKIDFISDRQEIDRILNSSESIVATASIYFSLATVLFVAVVFFLIFLSSAALIPIVERYAKTLEVEDTGVLVRTIWNPLLKTLAGSSAEIQRWRAELVTARHNEGIAQLTTMLAHDIRKPFTIAKAGLAGLREVKTISTMHARATVILKEVDQSFLQVEGMLEDIMESSRVRAPSAEETSLESLIQAATKEVFQINDTAKVDIKYVLNHTKQMNVESKQVARVLSNIANNAVQAMQGKRNTIYFATENLVEDGKCFVHISISNDGPIIPSEIIAQLFEHSFSSGKKGGTGLGLWISKKIITSHGGQIWCNSPGKTTNVEFHFTLPLMEKEKSPLSGILPASSEETLEMIKAARDFDIANTDTDTNTNTGASAIGDVVQDPTIIEYESKIKERLQAKTAGFKILLLDDETFYRDSLKDLIGEASPIKHLITFFDKSNPDGIADFIRTENPDLCIFDVDLRATQNGFEVTKLVRELGYKGKICLHSNRGLKEDLTTASAVGADTFCPKPMARIYMLKLIADTLSITFTSGKYEEKSDPALALTKKNLPIIICVEDSLTFRLMCQTAMTDANVLLFSHPEALLEAINKEPHLLPSATAILLDNNYAGLSELTGIKFGGILKNEYALKIPLILFSDGRFTDNELLGNIDAVLRKNVKTWAQMTTELPKTLFPQN